MTEQMKAIESAIRAKIANGNMKPATVKAIENALAKNALADSLIESINSPETSEQDKHMLRVSLLALLTIRMHESGKIEGVSSIDSHAISNPFCECMRKNAELVPDLVCGGCYACMAKELWKHTAQLAHLRNNLILSSVLFTDEELALISIPCDVMRPFCRINEDGDIADLTHALNILGIARTHNVIRFAVWHKNRKALYTALDMVGKPENVEIVFSVPIVSQSIDRIKAVTGRYDDKVFAVFRTEDEVSAAIAAGFVKCNGVKCMDCGFHCYRKQGEKVTYIAELLRTH